MSKRHPTGEAKNCAFCEAKFYRMKFASKKQWAGQKYCTHACYLKAKQADCPRAFVLERSTPDPNSGCWIWLNACAKSGYGKAKFKQQSIGAHRLSFAAFNGPIPDGLFVLHKCDVRCCVNPNHLKLGTHADNMTDMTARNRQDRGESRYCAKLPEAAIPFIRSSTLPITKLARMFDVSYPTIERVKSGKTWKHV